MLATFGSKLATAVVQPAVQAIAAGVLAGVVTGGALIVAGVVPPPAPGRTALLACPGSGAVVANVPAGQSLLATARSEDGDWLEVYVGQPGVDGAWAPAAAVHLQGSIDGLPVADCAPPSSAEPTPQPLPSPVATLVGTIEPTVEPIASPSFGPSLPPSISPSPSPKPTGTPKPPPTSTPTPSPVSTPTPTPFVNTPPSASGLGASSPCIDNGSASQSVITVTATDPDVGDTLTVRLRLGRIYKGLQYYRLGSFVMTPVGGNAYSYTITAAALQSYGWSDPSFDSEVTYDVTAYDTHSGASATLKSHDSDFTKVYYQSATGCSIG